jgi:hypothetical protein
MGVLITDKSQVQRCDGRSVCPKRLARESFINERIRNQNGWEVSQRRTAPANHLKLPCLNSGELD